MRILAWLIATVAVALYLATTAEHGLGVSLDSVVYARAAESFGERGTLEVPLTMWSAVESETPLAHFPPALPLVLAALSRAFDTDPVTASRWLNGLCLFATVSIVVMAVADNVLALLTVLALLAGPTFITNYLWLWSEPLFLLLLVVVVQLTVRIASEAEPLRDALLLGIFCALATLTRYTGASLFVGAVLVILLGRRPVATKARELLYCGGAYVVTMLPWIWWLATRSGPPREAGLFTDRIWGQILRPVLQTATRWFVPWLPLPAAVTIAVTVLVLVALAVAHRARTTAGFRIGVVTTVAVTLLVSHVAFLVVARIVADPGMPFDGRILSAALLLTALALSDIARAVFPGPPLLLAVLIVACMGLANASATWPQLAYAATEGFGYTNVRWKRSETIAWVREVSPGVTIFSNAPDAIAARLPVTAKYTPQNNEADRLPEFAERVARAAPAIVVLFEDPHAGWLVPREQLLALPGARREKEFADSIVVSWQSPAR